jgi:hypothetical protein
VAHIKCSDSPPSWLMATSKYFSTNFLLSIFSFCRRILFVTEISFLGIYDIDWKMKYEELHQVPAVIPDKMTIQILVKVSELKEKEKNKTNLTGSECFAQIHTSFKTVIK